MKIVYYVDFVKKRKELQNQNIYANSVDIKNWVIL